MIYRRFYVPRGWIVLALVILSWAVLAPLAVFAQEAGGIVVAVPPTEVVFNWGDWLAILLANLADPQSAAWTVFLGALAWLVAKLPGPAQWTFNVFKVDQLLMKSLQAAINSTKGATAGQSLNVNVGSEVLAKAIQYAIDNGQKWLIDWMGGRQGVQEKLFARMSLDTSVDGAELVQKAALLEGTKITDAVARPVPRPPRKKPTVAKKAA